MESDETRAHVGLWKLGAVSSLLIIVIYLIEIVVVAFRGLPPTTVEGWFSTLHENRFLGLLQSFALDVIAVGLHAPLYIALYFFLRSTTKAYDALVISVALSLIGIAVYYASNVTFSMLDLSDQFTSATSDAERVRILSSGRTLLAVFNGTGPFAAYLLYAVAGILVSVVMLSSGLFPRIAAIAGIMGNALELGLPPPIAPRAFLAMDPVLIGVGGVILLFWYAYITVRFLQASRLK